jgi:hypothetical protein
LESQEVCLLVKQAYNFFFFFAKILKQGEATS